MKKVFSIIAVAVVATFVACGPSADEKAKMEERAKFIQDSIAASISESMSAAEPAPDTNAVTPPAAEAATTAPADAHAH